MPLQLRDLDRRAQLGTWRQTNGMARIADELKARLDECVERDEQGRPRLTVTLPDGAALDNLARSLAALLG